MRNLLEREMLTRSGRALDGERVAMEVVIPLERLDEQEVEGQPDRPAPVRVPAKQARVRFARRVVETVLVLAPMK